MGSKRTANLIGVTAGPAEVTQTNVSLTKKEQLVIDRRKKVLDRFRKAVKQIIFPIKFRKMRKYIYIKRRTYINACNKLKILFSKAVVRGYNARKMMKAVMQAKKIDGVAKETLMGDRLAMYMDNFVPFIPGS
jgi:hypothetical protein